MWSDDLKKDSREFLNFNLIIIINNWWKIIEIHRKKSSKLLWKYWMRWLTSFEYHFYNFWDFENCLYIYISMSILLSL